MHSATRETGYKFHVWRWKRLSVNGIFIFLSGLTVTGLVTGFNFATFHHVRFLLPVRGTSARRTSFLCCNTSSCACSPERVVPALEITHVAYTPGVSTSRLQHPTSRTENVPCVDGTSGMAALVPAACWK
jgi:hypothetical protein